MMHTETEAKTKWCPHSLADSDVGGAFNRHSSDTTTAHGTNCLGSACMAWRWEESLQLKDTRQILKPNESYLPAQVETVRVTGYCGLAGKA